MPPALAAMSRLDDVVGLKMESQLRVFGLFYSCYLKPFYKFLQFHEYNFGRPGRKASSCLQTAGL